MSPLSLMFALPASAVGPQPLFVEDAGALDPQACGEPGRAGGRLVTGCDGMDEPRRSVLGSAQERWLAAGLADSRAQWKLLAQGSQVSAGGIDTPLGRRIFTDGWDGYPQARRRLLETIAERGQRDVLCLGGTKNGLMGGEA